MVPVAQSRCIQREAVRRCRNRAAHIAAIHLELNARDSTLELAVALTVVVPETVALAAGAVIDTVGGGTVLLTVTLTPALVVLAFEVSLATAVSVWLPLLSVVVFQEKLYGEAVTALPTLLPSTWN